MTDAKQKKTLSKLGRLFGVSSSNLSQLSDTKLSSPQGSRNVSLDSLARALDLPPARAASPSLDRVLDSQEDDVLFPLPQDHRSRTASPALESPPHLDGANGASADAVALVSTKSPSVSRLSSLRKGNGGGAAAKKPTAVSRSSSERRTNGQASPVNLSPSVSTANLPGILASNYNTALNKPRFKMFEDGSHEHNLRAAKRQEKLSNMLKDLLGAKKLRDEAKSAVPNILQPLAQNTEKSSAQPPTLFAGLVKQVKDNTSPYHQSHGEEFIPKQDCRSFVEKYGRCQEVIGRGSFGVVRISHKKADSSAVGAEETLYAVKEFKKRPNESEKKYSRRLTSEFCISSSLKHLNIIDTLDLLKDAKGDYCEVMEFCSGGDLYTLIIAAGNLEYAEADCFFKQLIRGVNYMHDMGVAHRDLKPENLLLTQQGVLKITDFGNGECFKMAWEKEIHFSDGVCGSSPYIAPEEFTQDQFDPRCVDIWACGVIYMAMRTGRQLWKLADPKRDEFFNEYLVQRKDASGYEPIESLKRARCRNVIYSILDPIPSRRITGKQILNSEWGREIRVCAAGDDHAQPKPTESTESR